MEDFKKFARIRINGIGFDAELFQVVTFDLGDVWQLVAKGGSFEVGKSSILSEDYQDGVLVVKVGLSPGCV